MYLTSALRASLRLAMNLYSEQPLAVMLAMIERFKIASTANSKREIRVYVFLKNLVQMYEMYY